jgi:hypothetical protein
MDFWDKVIIETEKTSTSFYDKNGRVISNGNKKAFAKIFTEQENKKSSYWVATYNGVIYDPIGVNSNKERYLETKFKKVSKETFDFYMIYLQTNNSIYLTRANRRFIND